MKFKLIILIVCFSITHLQAQETIPASGGEGTGGGIDSFSYTVGQLVYTTNSSGGSVTQGVQQSFEILTLSNPELTTVNLTALTYPNPTSDYITLKITDKALDNLSYELIDIQGKSIANSEITNSDTKIDMRRLTIGMYILKVSEGKQGLKTFKIIKK